MSRWIPAGLKEGGVLADPAPTLLGVLGISPPQEMTGQDLRVFERGQPRKGLFVQVGRLAGRRGIV